MEGRWIWQLLSIAWMLVPSVLVLQASRKLWLRVRLMRDPVPVVAEVSEVHPRGFGEEGHATVVELRVSFGALGRAHDRWVTRMGPEAATYQLGSPVKLVHEQGNPANSIDAASRPWDDVLGSLVFSALLFAFMGWLLLFAAQFT